MAKNILDLRLGVKRHDGFISSVWRLWATRSGDVYLATRSHAAVTKYSFHRSGICRCALTSQYSRSQAIDKRLAFKWRRKATPTIPGEAARVAGIAFPTDFLSRQFIDAKKEVTWFTSAPSGLATYLEFIFTYQAEHEVCAHLDRGGIRTLVSYSLLPTDEAFAAIVHYGECDNRDLNSPAGEESVFPDLLFSTADPDDTGRPIRMVFGPMPGDGDALLLTELGGYKAGT